MQKKLTLRTCIAVILCCVTILVLINLLFSLIYLNGLAGIPSLTPLRLWLQRHTPMSFFSAIFPLISLVALIICITVLVLIAQMYGNMRLSRNQALEIMSRQVKKIEEQTNMIENLTTLYHGMTYYDNLKTEFFSNISHELKTPLTVILGAIQLMEKNNTSLAIADKKMLKHQQTIKHNCYRLLRLINNTLDITRIDSGFVKLNKKNCNLVYLADEITQSVVPYAEQKDLSVEFDTQDEEIITGIDIDKIERILLNLLSNAIKFTPQGGKITVNMWSAQRYAYISVKDTGPGIPENMHKTIFERFRQVNSSLTRDHEGSGIGLSLVKSFVDLHDGSIRVNSQPDQGSEFIIELPIKLCEADPIESEPQSLNQMQNRIIEAIHIEFSDIYSAAS